MPEGMSCPIDWLASLGQLTGLFKAVLTANQVTDMQITERL